MDKLFFNRILSIWFQGLAAFSPELRSIRQKQLDKIQLQPSGMPYPGDLPG